MIPTECSMILINGECYEDYNTKYFFMYDRLWNQLK
jgi:hypothetical protein